MDKKAFVIIDREEIECPVCAIEWSAEDARNMLIEEFDELVPELTMAEKIAGFETDNFVVDTCLVNINED